MTEQTPFDLTPDIWLVSPMNKRGIADEKLAVRIRAKSREGARRTGVRWLRAFKRPCRRVSVRRATYSDMGVTEIGVGRQQRQRTIHKLMLETEFRKMSSNARVQGPPECAERTEGTLPAPAGKAVGCNAPLGSHKQES